MENKTKKFLEKIDMVYRGNIPEYVKKKARYALLDYLCVTSAGVKYNKEKLKKYFLFNEIEKGEYKAIGLEGKYSLKEAAFLNGLNSHALDYDDGTNAGIIHLGSPIFSVLMPILQKREISVDKVLKAVIIGYEASFTMAYSIQPNHKLRGFHATGTCGIFGAILALCYALNLSKSERENAFSIAGVSSSGMLKVLDDGSELKPYNVAKTALMTIVSLQMARAGFTGHHDVLAGKRGFLSMMAGDEDVEIRNPLLNGTYAIEKIYTKPYAACRYCHPAIDAALLVRNEMSLSKDNFKNIIEIKVETYGLAIAGHDQQNISSVAAAKMSIPYSVGIALLNGKAGLTEYSIEYINDQKIIDIMKKIVILENFTMSKKFPKKQSAKVIIKTNYHIYEKMVEYPKGEPENPFTKSEFKSRFLNMYEYAGKNNCESEVIYNKVLNEEKDFRAIMDMI